MRINYFFPVSFVLFLAGGFIQQTHAQPVFRFFDGLEHRSLGAAILDAGTNELTVSNIGSSGEDGVSIALGEAEFHIVQFDPGSAAALPTGAYVRVTTRGVLNDVPDQEIWSIKAEDLGSEFGISFDARRVEPGQVRVEARLGDQIVDSRVFTSPPAFNEIIVRVPVEGCWIDPFWPMPPECWAILAFARPGPVTILGRPTVTADRIVVATIEQRARVGSLSATQMRAANVPRIVLTDETLGMFDLQNRAAGQARLTGRAGTLEVSNLGSSGQDGVNVLLPTGTRAVDISLQPVSLAVTGSVLRISADGTFNGVTNQSLGFAGLRNNAGTIEAFANLAAIGSGNVQVGVFTNGAPVGTATVAGGGTVARIAPVAGVPVPRIISVGKLAPQPNACYSVGLDCPASITPVGGPTLVGNELRLLAVNPTGIINSLSQYRIAATGVGTLTITGERPSEGETNQLDAVLTIRHVPPGSVRLLWPTNDPAYVLQCKTNLTTTNWTDVTSSPIIVGANYVVTNTIGGAQKFYRLCKP